MYSKGEIAQNDYQYNGKQLVDTTTGHIVNTEDIKKAHEIYLQTEYMRLFTESVEMGVPLDIKVVKGKYGEEYQTTNVKEGFHFVKAFKVDIRDTLECENSLSIFARGFLYSCLAYLHFPSNSLVISGSTPTNEVICEKFKIGKSKLYEVYKELETLDIIKRKKVNGQMVIYLNPFLHSSGLVDVETQNLFKDSYYNPINRKV